MSELDDMDDDMSCDEFAGVAAELALGVLTGRGRAAALAHLDGCESCRERVRQLALAQDALLALLPPQEPPAGFESRVLERIGITASGQQPADAAGRPADAGARTDDRVKRRRSRPRRPDNRPPNQPGNAPAGRPRTRLSRRLLAAAAVAVALIGGGVGWGLRDAAGPALSSQSAALSTAAFVTSNHENVGQVFVYNRSPWWAYMVVNMKGQGGSTVRCQLEMSDGRFHNIGAFRLANGYGAWASSPYTVGPGAILGARLLGANGAVLATAAF